VSTTRSVVILVENAPAPSDRRVWQEASALTRSGAEVSVICPQGTSRDTEPFERCEGVSIYRYPARFADGGLLDYGREYSGALREMRRRLRRISDERKIDVVHACNPPDILLLTALRVRRDGAAFVFDQHDLVPEQARSQFAGRPFLYRSTLVAERLAYSLADVVLVTNESYRDVALSRGRREEDDVYVVRNAPDLSFFRRVDPDLSLRKGASFLIGYVGLMGPQDGVDHTLRALASLKKRRSDWRAIFVGEGEALPDARLLTERLGLEEVVEFTGWVAGERLTTTLATFDVCVAPNPKTPLNEVSTMVKLLEYMAMAKPVVAYDLPETRRTAENAAVYARPDDPSSMAALIDALLDDPDQRARMGAAGRARIETVLSWEHAERELLAAYDRAYAVADGRKSRSLLLRGRLRRAGDCS
jgi:glycosyltransferase involved in cell wall biosynthesis